MEATLIWGHTDRPWGYEVRVDYQDDNGKIYNEVLNFPSEPNQIEIESAVEVRRLKLVEMAATLTEIPPMEPEIDPQTIKAQFMDLVSQGLISADDLIDVQNCIVVRQQEELI